MTFYILVKYIVPQIHVSNFRGSPTHCFFDVKMGVLIAIKHKGHCVVWSPNMSSFLGNTCVPTLEVYMSRYIHTPNRYGLSALSALSSPPISGCQLCSLLHLLPRLSFFIRVSAYIYHCESLIRSIGRTSRLSRMICQDLYADSPPLIVILLPSTAPQGLVILS